MHVSPSVDVLASVKRFNNGMHGRRMIVTINYTPVLAKAIKERTTNRRLL
jgi:hypothetical protein